MNGRAETEGQSTKSTPKSTKSMPKSTPKSMPKSQVYIGFFLFGTYGKWVSFCEVLCGASAAWLLTSFPTPCIDQVPRNHKTNVPGTFHKRSTNVPQMLWMSRVPFETPPIEIARERIPDATSSPLGDVPCSRTDRLKTRFECADLLTF